MTSKPKPITPHVGFCVELSEEYDCFPTGVFAAGLGGVVTEVSDTVISVTLYETRRELEEWGNALQVYPDHCAEGETLVEAFWRMFKHEGGGPLPALVDEYTAWNKAQGLNLGSADEHMYDEALTEDQQLWVQNFCRRWDEATGIERATIDLRKLGAAARPHDADEWGSERQIEAQNKFTNRVNEILTEQQQDEYESWCLKANVDEMIDKGQEMAIAELMKGIDQ